MTPEELVGPLPVCKETKEKKRFSDETRFVTTPSNPRGLTFLRRTIEEEMLRDRVGVQVKGQTHPQTAILLNNSFLAAWRSAKIQILEITYIIKLEF